jgi:hypothetical protein
MPTSRHSLDRLTRRTRQFAEVWRRDGAQVLLGRVMQGAADRLLAGARPFNVDVLPADLAHGEPPIPAGLDPDAAQLTINWIMNPPDGSGGLMTMSRLVSLLEKRGHLCRLYVRYGGVRHDLARDRVVARERFPHMNAELYDYDDGMEPADAVFATGWPTAYAARRSSAPGVRFYLVQDFEPWFYAMGSNAVLAEETYRFGFHGLTAGRWLASKLAADYGMTCDSFDLGVDTNVYKVTNEGARPGVVFYARPDTERRGYELGMLALDRFARIHPEAEIHLVGQELRWRRPTFRYTSHGYTSASELAEIYNRCAAGLVLSLTNLSLLPAEMLAAGCLPVMNDAEHVRASFTNPYAQFAPCEPDRLAQAERGTSRLGPRGRSGRGGSTARPEAGCGWLRRRGRLAGPGTRRRPPSHALVERWQSWYRSEQPDGHGYDSS